MQPPKDHHEHASACCQTIASLADAAESAHEAACHCEGAMKSQCQANLTTICNLIDAQLNMLRMRCGAGTGAAGSLLLLAVSLFVGCTTQPAATRDFKPLAAAVISTTLVSSIPVIPVPTPAPATICKECKGTGKLGDGTVSVKCPICGGDGRIDSDPRDPDHYQAPKSTSTTAELVALMHERCTCTHTGMCTCGACDCVPEELRAPGFTYVAVPPEDRRKLCPDCRGSGKCPTCDGSGMTDISVEATAPLVEVSRGGRSRPGFFGRIRARRSAGGRGVLGFRGCRGC